MEKLVIAGREFSSRLFLGTGKFNSNEVMEQAILASGTEMVTVAMKRIDMDNKEDDMLKHIIHPNIQLLPNTSGVRNAEEAVFAAQLAREALSCYLIARLTLYSANGWKKQAQLPLCRSVHPSVRTKDCRQKNSCKSLSNRQVSRW